MRYTAHNVIEIRTLSTRLFPDQLYYMCVMLLLPGKTTWQWGRLSTLTSTPGCTKLAGSLFITRWSGQPTYIQTYVHEEMQSRTEIRTEPAFQSTCVKIGNQLKLKYS